MIDDMFERIIRGWCDRCMCHSIFHVHIIGLINQWKFLRNQGQDSLVMLDLRSNTEKQEDFYLRDWKMSNTNCFRKFRWTFSWSRFSTMGSECRLFFSSSMIESRWKKILLTWDINYSKGNEKTEKSISFQIWYLHETFEHFILFLLQFKRE